MKQKPKELTIEEQLLEEFSDIIVSLILKSNLWEESEENQKQETSITSTHQNSDKYP